jgi:glucose-1-phosphate thymidylyltransferase
LLTRRQRQMCIRDRVIEERQGMKVGCIEEVAYRMGYIDKAQLKKIAEPLVKSGYGQYLLNLIA